jgi:predicted lipid-binding transport protein (Tim44 family)
VKPTAAAVLAASTALASTATAFARVGGGGGYSGGGGSGGGGGGDAGLIFGLVRLLLWLVFAHPIVGIPLVIVIVIVVLNMAKSGTFGRSVGENPTVFPQQAPVRRGPANLTPVRSTDPFFSEPVFTDFAQLVYARAQEMRGTGNRQPLEAWMAQEAIDKLFADRVNLSSVSQVVFGATRIAQAATEAGFVRIDVEFEANVTERRGGGQTQVLCSERWSFRRKAGVRSPAPERMRALGCAGCGSTLEPGTDGACPSCGAPRRGGLTQWEVGGIPHANRRPLAPPELDVDEGGGIERGTELSTVCDPRLSAAKRAFEGRHPDHVWPAFEERVRVAFLALQDAWSSRRWERARPFETDALFQTHRFWMERYAAFSLVNRVEQVAVTRVALAKIDVDAFYESITMRIFARALDWTEDAAGKVVGGSTTAPRAFSEYWTFLRAIPGTAAAPSNCPSCGAPLVAGGGATVCASCGGKLVGGAFDWVASRIEQDDAYA